MVAVPILGLTAITPPLTGNEQFPVVQGGATKRASINDIFASVGSGFVPDTRQIIAGAGLVGGGALSANVTLSVADTGVTATTYGTAIAVPQFTVNSRGQITSAQNVPITASGIGAVGSVSGTPNEIAVTGSHAVTVALASALYFGGKTVSGGTFYNMIVNNITVSGGTEQGVTYNSPTISGGTLQGITVSGGTFNNPTINNETVSGGTLQGITVSGGTFNSPTINNVTISGSTFNNSTFNNPTVSGGNFSGPRLSSAVAAGNWTTSGTWALPALTLSGAVTATGQTVVGGSFNGPAISGGTQTGPAISVASAGGNWTTSGTWALPAITLSGAVTATGQTITAGTFNNPTVSGGNFSAPRLSLAVAAGPWTTSGTWFTPAMTLSGAVTATGQTITNGAFTGGTWNNGVIGGTSQAAITGTVITGSSFIPTGSTAPTNGLYLAAANVPTIAANSQAAVAFTAPASPVNYWNMASAATGTALNLSANGSDSNISLTFQAKGTGNINFNSDTLTGFVVAYPGASAVNRPYAQGSATGGMAGFGTTGSDASIPLKLFAKAGNINFYTNGDQDTQGMQIAHAASATRYAIITPSNGGNVTVGTNAGSLVLGSAGIAGFRVGQEGTSTSGLLIFMPNITVSPSSNPVAGGYLYTEAGALKYRGSAGTVSTIAPA